MFSTNIRASTHPQPAAEQRTPLARRRSRLALSAIMPRSVHGTSSAIAGTVLSIASCRDVGEKHVQQLPGPHLVPRDQPLRTARRVDAVLQCMSLQKSFNGQEKRAG